MLEARVVTVTESPRLDRGSMSFKTDRIVQFMVGEHGPFQFAIPAEEFTGERVKAILEEHAREIRALFPE